MSIIAEFVQKLPTDALALETVPEMRLAVEGMTACDPDTVLLTFWAEGDDFETFETELERSEIITSVEPLSERIDGRKLYQIRLPATRTTYWAWAERGGVLLDSTISREGIRMRMRFPGREALVAYRTHCESRGWSFTLTGLRTTDTLPEEFNDGLTTSQHEVLAAAIEDGYFDIPRRVLMTDLAARFGISDQAASERLRRGLSNVLEDAMFDRSNHDRTNRHRAAVPITE